MLHAQEGSELVLLVEEVDGGRAGRALEFGVCGRPGAGLFYGCGLGMKIKNPQCVDFISLFGLSIPYSQAILQKSGTGIFLFFSSLAAAC